MTSTQVAARDGRIPLSIVVAVVAVAFALGALIGFGLPRIVDGIGQTTESAVVAPAVATVAAPRDMSDAAYEATHRPTSTTMSDAAYEATHRPTSTTMSDAAYEAMHPASNAP